MAEFLDDYTGFTFGFSLASRGARLEERIRRHEQRGLSLADKAEAFRRVSPRRDPTGPRDELRLTRLLLSVGPADLPRFKFALDHDGDYKDLEEYLFHDVDSDELRAAALNHLRAAAAAPIGLKILTDVDDTLYANLVDRRYPKGTLYPGVLALYEALKLEPFALRPGPDGRPGVPITTLSARPNPVAGKLEEGSLEGLIERTGGRVRPSALSGRVVSSAIGTLETLAREKRAEVDADFAGWLTRIVPGADRGELPPHPDGLERQIGEVKFDNFRRYARVYPEYRFVFFGDSGQADAVTAQRMALDAGDEFDRRVLATFIHDLREAEDDPGAASPSFREIVLHGDAAARRAPIIRFRNHIDAALKAHRHSPELLPAAALARVTPIALAELAQIDFGAIEASGERLGAQHAGDARAALVALGAAPGLDEEVRAIERALTG